MTKGTIYFHFTSKERVFDEMVRHVFRSVFPELQEYARGLDGTYISRLRSLLGFVYKRLALNRSSGENVRFLIAEETRFPESVDRHFEEFVQPMLNASRERSRPASLPASFVMAPPPPTQTLS